MTEEYKNMKGHGKKEQFRLKWCAMKVKDAEKKAIKEKKHSKVEACTGTYVPFKRLWDREGDNLAGYRAPSGQWHISPETPNTC